MKVVLTSQVLGEYAGESGDIDLKVLIQHLKAVYMRSSSSRVTRAWILSGLIKLGSFVQLPLEALETFKSSIEPQDSDLRQVGALTAYIFYTGEMKYGI